MMRRHGLLAAYPELDHVVAVDGGTDEDGYQLYMDDLFGVGGDSEIGGLHRCRASPKWARSPMAASGLPVARWSRTWMTNWGTTVQQYRRSGLRHHLARLRTSDLRPS